MTIRRLGRPVKLRHSGKWGASVTGRANVGDEVAVTTRNGTMLMRVVTEVIHRTADETIVAVKSLNRGAK